MVKKSEIALMRQDFGIDPPEEWYEQIPYPPAWSLIQNRLSGKIVLDIGACTGWLSVLIRREGGLVISTDIFYINKSRVGLIRLACDMEHLPFRDRVFNAVITANTLHHGALDKTVKEAYRVLHINGELISLEEPCILNDMNEEECLKKYCEKELSLGIDEKRPSLIKYKNALNIFKHARFFALPYGIFSKPLIEFSTPTGNQKIIDISDYNTYFGGIAIKAIK